MSSISSAASADSVSASNEPECEPLHSVRSTHSAAACSPGTGPKCHATTTCELLPSPRPTLMSSAAASHVRISASPGPAPDLPALVRDSTGNSFEPFAWYDRATQSWRTWQRCLVEGWERFSQTWPRSGMTRNGIAFRRAPLVHSTTEIEFGLLPTLEASNTKAIALRSAGRSPRNWLKPLPTLTKRDWRSGKGKTQTERGRTTGPSMAEVANGPLNPTWCEWFMGFPRGWTELQLSAMPSSRKSRKS